MGGAEAQGQTRAWISALSLTWAGLGRAIFLSSKEPRGEASQFCHLAGHSAFAFGDMSLNGF